MERGLTHPQIQELLGAYALDAVEADEAALVAEHIEECPSCRDEVAGHREAAALLAHVGAPAPAGVWDKIAMELGGAGADDALADEADRAAAEIASLAERRAEGSGLRRAPDARPLGSAPAARGWFERRAQAVLLSAAAVVIAVLGVQLIRTEQRLDRAQEAAAARSLNDAALVASADPDARHVRLKSDDGSRQADAVLLPNGQAYLLVHSLPELSKDQTYQLGAVVGDQKISVGVLGPKPTVTAFHYDDEPSVLAVTAERAGGVVASEKQAVMVGFVERDEA